MIHWPLTDHQSPQPHVRCPCENIRISASLCGYSFRYSPSFNLGDGCCMEVACLMSAYAKA